MRKALRQSFNGIIFVLPQKMKDVILNCISAHSLKGFDGSILLFCMFSLIFEGGFPNGISSLPGSLEVFIEPSYRMNINRINK